MVISEPRVPTRAIPGSIILLQLGICFDVQGPSYHHCIWSGLPHEAVLISEGCAAPEDHVDLSGLYGHLRLW